MDRGMSDLLLAVVSVAFCFRPFMRGNLQILTTSKSDTPIGRLGQRKETLLQNIDDLDFEYNMGKLSEEDYASLRANLKRQAMETFEQLDLLRESNDLFSPGGVAQEKAKPKGLFCTQCGTVLTGADRFCSSCGTKVSQHR
jgi:rubrerythrin